MSIKTKEIYITDDGKEYTDKEEATKHQKELDNCDYKNSYFNLLKKYEELERQYNILKSINDFYKIPDVKINKEPYQTPAGDIPYPDTNPFVPLPYIVPRYTYTGYSAYNSGTTDA